MRGKLGSWHVQIRQHILPQNRARVGRPKRRQVRYAIGRHDSPPDPLEQVRHFPIRKSRANLNVVQIAELLVNRKLLKQAA